MSSLPVWDPTQQCLRLRDLSDSKREYDNGHMSMRLIGLALYLIIQRQPAVE